MKISAEKMHAIRRFAAEISEYPTEQIETLLREQAQRDAAELRRQYPELFENDGKPN